MTAIRVNWHDIASELRQLCPSPSLRAAAVELLELVEQIGPLRTPQDEFRRVYNSLHWNEPERVRRIVQVIRARTQGPKPQTRVRAEAWGYVIAALDEWITHGRIFYLVTGILESTLRARVHARMADYYGTDDWTAIPEAVPSPLRERALSKERERQFRRVKRLVKGVGGESLTLEQHQALLANLRAMLTEPSSVVFPRGDDFLRNFTTLHDLLMWFQGRRFWNEPILMREMFRGRDGAGPVPPYSKVESVFKWIHEARNAMAHFRPGADLSFAEPFFAAATLASWMGEDLQHIYGSMDSRSSTELSALLGPLGDEIAGWCHREDHHACVLGGCTTYPPLDWLLERAPRDRDELATIPVRRACAYHRIVIRDHCHRPPSFHQMNRGPFEGDLPPLPAPLGESTREGT